MDFRQQEFLRRAAAILGFSQSEMATRMGAPWPTFKKWLLPPDSENHREMPEIAWQLVREILAHERLKRRIARNRLQRYPMGTTISDIEYLLTDASLMNEFKKMLFNMQRFQILSRYTNPNAKQNFSAGYAFAWHEHIYPLLNESARLHEPYADCFEVQETQFDELHEFLADRYDTNKPISFYELEDHYNVQRSASNTSVWSRMPLVNACKYLFLEEQFDETFWNHLLENGKCPSEAFSIKRKFNSSNVYFE